MKSGCIFGQPESCLTGQTPWTRSYKYGMTDMTENANCYS